MYSDNSSTRGYGRKAFEAIVIRPSGLRLYGLRATVVRPSGFVRLNFRVTISGVSNLGY